MSMSITLLAILSVLVTLAIVFIYRKRKANAEYWTSRGFPKIQAKMAASIFQVIFNRLLQFEVDYKMYKHIKQDLQKQFAGFMEFTKPCLFIVDLDLAKKIFVKDFDSFINRRQLNAMQDTDPMFFKMLFFMEDEPWKELRGKMSPTFTTGKIRRLIPIFQSSSDKLVKHLDKDRTSDKYGQDVVDFVDVYGRYTMDVIASAAFGVDSKTFTEDDPIFQRMGKTLQLELTPLLMFSFIVMIVAPKLAALLGLGFTDKKAETFFTEVILSAIRHRESTGEKRDDFLQIMLEARNGQLKAVDETELDSFEKDARLTTDNANGSSNTGKVVDKVKLTDEMIVAQSVLFILAGFDTTQTVLLFCVYELAINPEVQDELSREVETFLNNNNGKFNYEAINRMEYLDKVINETLRKYPPVPRLERRAKIDFKIPDTELIIPKNTLVAIPTYPIHHDEEYFPNPEKFDPERFDSDVKNTRHPYAFQPFGHGPRNCIGMRFALTNVKMVIANIVHNFVLEPAKSTVIPMRFAKTTSLKPESMFLKLKPRF